MTSLLISGSSNGTNLVINSNGATVIDNGYSATATEAAIIAAQAQADLGVSNAATNAVALTNAINSRDELVYINDVSNLPLADLQTWPRYEGNLHNTGYQPPVFGAISDNFLSSANTKIMTALPSDASGVKIKSDQPTWHGIVSKEYYIANVNYNGPIGLVEGMGKNLQDFFTTGDIDFFPLDYQGAYKSSVIVIYDRFTGKLVHAKSLAVLTGSPRTGNTIATLGLCATRNQPVLAPDGIHIYLTIDGGASSVILKIKIENLEKIWSKTVDDTIYNFDSDGQVPNRSSNNSQGRFLRNLMPLEQSNGKVRLLVTWVTITYGKTSNSYKKHSAYATDDGEPYNQESPSLICYDDNGTTCDFVWETPFITKFYEVGVSGKDTPQTDSFALKPHLIGDPDTLRLDASNLEQYFLVFDILDASSVITSISQHDISNNVTGHNGASPVCKFCSVPGTMHDVGSAFQGGLGTMFFPPGPHNLQGWAGLPDGSFNVNLDYTLYTTKDVAENVKFYSYTAVSGEIVGDVSGAVLVGQPYVVALERGSTQVMTKQQIYSANYWGSGSYGGLAYDACSNMLFVGTSNAHLFPYEEELFFRTQVRSDDPRLAGLTTTWFYADGTTTDISLLNYEFQEIKEVFTDATNVRFDVNYYAGDYVAALKPVSNMAGVATTSPYDVGDNNIMKRRAAYYTVSGQKEQIAGNATAKATGLRAEKDFWVAHEIRRVLAKYRSANYQKLCFSSILGIDVSSGAINFKYRLAGKDTRDHSYFYGSVDCFSVWHEDANNLDVIAGPQITSVTEAFHAPSMAEYGGSPEDLAYQQLIGNQSAAVTVNPVTTEYLVVNAKCMTLTFDLSAVRNDANAATGNLEPVMRKRFSNNHLANLNSAAVNGRNIVRRITNSVGNYSGDFESGSFNPNLSTYLPGWGDTTTPWFEGTPVGSFIEGGLLPYGNGFQMEMGGRNYVTNMCPYIMSFDILTGRELWSRYDEDTADLLIGHEANGKSPYICSIGYATPNQGGAGFISGAVSMYGTTVIIGSHLNKIVLYNVYTGLITNKIKTNSGALQGAPCVNGVLYHFGGYTKWWTTNKTRGEFMEVISVGGS